MQRKELTFDVIEVLKGAMDKFLPELIQKVRETLGPRDLRLFDYIFKHYYSGNKMTGRWYDPYHIISGIPFTVQLVRTDEQVSPLITPAFNCHDIGYCALLDKKDLLAAKTRILHMQEGAAATAKSLIEVGDYNAFETGVIVEMVATHDNWILDIQTEDPDCLALIDADKMFVMSFVSFYKDWVGKEGENLSVEEFLDVRQRSFYGGKHSLFTGLVKQRRDGQFAARRREIQQDILRDENYFRQYAENQIRAELAASEG